MGDKMNILEEFNELEKRAQKAISEQHALDAERNVVKRDVAKKMKELKEMGVEFETKEDLDKIYDETEKNLELSLQSLKRKLEEYENLKQDVEGIDENDDIGGVY